MKATRLASIEELLRRGLLKADDAVSVDGSDFIPLHDLDELRSFFEGAFPGDPADEEVGTESLSAGMKTPADDPWRHWTKEENAAEDDGADDVLSSFLGEVKATESGTFPAIRRSNPRLPAMPRSPKPGIQAIRGDELEEIVDEQEPPQNGSGSTSEPIGPVVVSGTDLESIPQPLPSESHQEKATSEDRELRPRTVADVTPREPSIPPRSDAELAREMMENPDLPLTFRDWLEKSEEDAQEGTRLERFGRYDDGIFRTADRSRRGFSLFRVLLTVALGLVGMGSWYLYVHTAAESPFPKESELATRVPGAVGLKKPSTEIRQVDSPGASTALALSPELLGRRAREKAVRQKVRGGVLPFGSAGDLEDAIFQELTNAGAKPIMVTLESRTANGAASRDRRPSQAKISVSLNTIAASGDTGFEVLEERLMVVWLIVGKYQSLGNVQFEDVRVKIPPPLAWNRSYEGRELALLWEQQIEAARLFPEE